MKITLNLNDQLLRQAERQAARAGVTVAQVVEDALRARLEGALSGKPPFRFRLVTVTGHAPPNVDIADQDALYDVVSRA